MSISLDHAMSLVPPLFLLWIVCCYIPWLFLKGCHRLVSSESFTYQTSPMMTTTTTTTHPNPTKATTTKRNKLDRSTNSTTPVALLMLLGYSLSPIASTWFGNMSQLVVGGGKDGGDSTARVSSVLGLHDLIHGYDPKLKELIQRLPRLIHGPTPPLLFHNRHLQFLPWMLQNEIHRQYGIPYQTIELNVTACVDKSVPNCYSDPYMSDTITIDIFPPLTELEYDDSSCTAKADDPSSYTTNFNRSSPIILFAPGLTCYSQDMPGNMIVRLAYGEGFRSIVVNRRGHVRNQKLGAPRFSILGDIDDMEQAYWYIRNELFDEHTAIFLHAVSAGTAVSVSGLSQWDERNKETQRKNEKEQQWDDFHEEQWPSSHTNMANTFIMNSTRTTTTTPTNRNKAPTFVASVAVTPGYDCSKLFLPERFQFPYNDILTITTAHHFVQQNEAILRAFDSKAVDAALQANNLQDLVDAVSPFAGYPNATSYHYHTNPINEIRNITTPMLVLNALDDPCCNIGNLYETSPYEHHEGKSYAQLATETPAGMIAVTATGSHCPFLDTSGGGRYWFPFVRDPLHGGWMLNSWADQVSIDYYRAALDVYNDRR